MTIAEKIINALGGEKFIDFAGGTGVVHGANGFVMTMHGGAGKIDANYVTFCEDGGSIYVEFFKSSAMKSTSVTTISVLSSDLSALRVEWIAATGFTLPEEI